MTARQEDLREQSDAESREDVRLMLAYQQGDVTAFEELVRRHRRGLYNFLLRSVASRSRAEELLQEVLLRVVRSRARYQPRAKFTTWVYTIARNLCVDESRRRPQWREVSLEAPRGRSEDSSTSLRQRLATSEPTSVGPAEARQIRERVAAAVANLPGDQREVFVLRQVNELSFREIAEIASVSENTVKSRMRYALEKLRSELGELYRSEPERDDATTRHHA
ncbi:MAG: RNA polymerase sigma factor [Myxococcales bacterium FL481]|nr:MAG: RNA polymerase sigma factor [Myxococcales bacterium FL481]